MMRKTKAAKSSTCLTCRVGHVACEFLGRISLQYSKLPLRSPFLGRPPRGFGGPLKSDGGTAVSRTHFLRKLVDKSRSSAIAVDRGSHFAFRILKPPLKHHGDLHNAKYYRLQRGAAAHHGAPTVTTHCRRFHL